MTNRFHILVLCFILLGFGPSKTVEGATEKFYRAAVVEFAADENGAGLEPLERLWRNLGLYQNIIAQASEKGTDIIVFPEYGLTTLTFFRQGPRESILDLIDPLLQTVPSIGSDPCEETGPDSVIGMLSCAAKQNSVWIVVNLGEKVLETGNEEILQRFNTALVFDRNGTLVTRYRKNNLFAEPWFDVPEPVEAFSFQTDFGVEFGVIICFDLLFEKPAKQLVTDGIKHFVFPTAWIDELPYLTALQAHMMWSSSSNATLLASGYHNPAFGKLGSGIYDPSGEPLVYSFDPLSGTRVIYADVPKTPTRQETKSKGVKPNLQTQFMPIVDESRKLLFYYRENLTNYTAVTLQEDSDMVEACHDNFCCQVHYTFSKVMPKLCDQEDLIKIAYSDAEYKLIVFNNSRKFQSPSVVKTMDLQICSVVRCLNGTIESCAENDASSRLPGFAHLEIKGGPFHIINHSRPGVTTLDVNFAPAPIEVFNIDRSLEMENQSVALSSKHASLPLFQIQTVALFHRKYQ